MNRLFSVATFAVAAVVATAAMAAPLTIGAKAPDVQTKTFLDGKEADFKLADALKKGPVVLYFFPAADTKGCNLEAKMFADAMPQFAASGATVIGVTAGNLDKLQQISSDTDKCSGKFPVAADPGAKIAKQYDSVLAVKPDWSDRTSYVIASNGQIVHAYTKMDPTEHVSETLAAVKALKAKK